MSHNWSFPLHQWREMPVTGGHFHDFVAIGISWIRGWCIRTPWCSEEFSSPGQQWCELYSVATNPYSHWTKGGEGCWWDVEGKNASAKMHKLTIAINSPIVHFQQCAPFKTVLLSNQKPMGFFSHLMGPVLVGRMVSMAATKHRETLALCQKPVKQFGKSLTVATLNYVQDKPMPPPIVVPILLKDKYYPIQWGSPSPSIWRKTMWAGAVKGMGEGGRRMGKKTEVQLSSCAPRKPFDPFTYPKSPSRRCSCGPCMK